MLSTIRLLKNGRVLTNVLCNEGSRGFHVHVLARCGNRIENRLTILARNCQISTIGVDSVKYASTNSSTITETPTPPANSADIQVLSAERNTINDSGGGGGQFIPEERYSEDIQPVTQEEMKSLEPASQEEVALPEVLPKETFTNEEVLSENVSEVLPEIDLGSEVSPEILYSEDLLEPVSDEVLPLVEVIDAKDIPDAPLPIESTPGGSLPEIFGEPTFQSIGLGGYSPVGIFQNCMEFLHITCDIPWWGSIALGTVVVRLLMFPLVILSQRNAAKMNNCLPEMQIIQLKMSDARERGDRLDSARYAQELMMFMKEKGLNPLKNMMVPLAQAPLFISFFMGLRGMANLPVESMKEGGLFWFTDLTVPDEFYLLPLLTSATLALTIEVGTDTARLNSSNMGMLKYVLRAMPVAIFPFILNFPSAILVYWASSNFISLCQVASLRVPQVREYFKIDKIVTHDKKKLPIKDKGFVKGMKESWTNMKISKELEDRERADEINFTRAGRGPIRKTFKFDPTRPRLPRNIPTIHAKKQDD